MKTQPYLQLAAAMISLASFPSAGCAEKEKPAGTVPPPAKEVTAGAATVEPPPAASDAAGADAATARWADIKDITYDMRARFFTGLQGLESKVDAQIAELAAKRAAMKSTANTKDWDFAMKEMGNARSYLKAMGEELGKATPETWDQQKDKVGRAWVRTQDACGKVRSSTTN